MRDRRFGTLRQDDADPVAALYAQARECVRETIGLLLQIPEGVGGGGPAFVFPVESEAGAVVRVPAAAGRAMLKRSGTSHLKLS